jgi:WD40 repeat protein
MYHSFPYEPSSYLVGGILSSWKDSIATGGRCICLWDPEAIDDDINFLSSIIETEGFDVDSLVYSPNGLFLASIVNSSVKIWRASDGSLVHTLGGHLSASACSFFPNGKLVAFGE